MKGVILAGGKGSRMLPFTKRLNKALAPLYSPDGAIPQLLYPLNTLINSNIKDILIITSRDHCGHIVELLGDGSDYNCNLTYKIQEMDRPIVGIAQALGLSKDFINNDNFAVILGDNYYEDTFKIEFEYFDRINNLEPKNISNSHIFIKTVEDPERFGVATLDDDKVIKIVEKPKKPETNYAVTGLYLYTPHVFELLPHLKPSHRNELEITDINNWYVQNKTMRSTKLEGFWCDMGLPTTAKKVSDHLWNNNA